MQKKITKDIALNILLENIKDKKELLMPQNRWIQHSIYVGYAAERIARAIGINSDKALIYGYLHDIGKKINYNNHFIEGYNYLMNLGYENEARICLTHSFIDNDIENTINDLNDIRTYNFIDNYLKNNPHTIYDKIIQLCNLLCIEKGYTTIEKKLLDIVNQKGMCDNFYIYYQSIINLKNRIEKGLNYNLYTLFPEINKEDLDNIIKNTDELLNKINNYNKKYLKI